MVGEDKSAGSTFTAVACYSSTDLVHWTRQTDALSRQASGDLAAGRIVERPKVLFNRATGRYVMWMHIDNTSYNDQRAGVAVSTTPCGPYTYLGATRPLGHPSRDLGLFKDDDDTAYMIHEDPAAGMRIERLAADYTSAQSTVATFPSLESPAMAKVGGRYFLLTSHLTGWATNDNVYATATSLAGPWSGFSNFAVAGTRTYDSQTSFLLPVTGSAGTNYVYVGDRWNPSNLNASVPVWLPITLTSAGRAVLSWHSSWGIDASTGAVALTAGRLIGNPVRPLPGHHRSLPGQRDRSRALGLQRWREPDLRAEHRRRAAGVRQQVPPGPRPGHHRGDHRRHLGLHRRRPPEVDARQ
jgi:hypothetical protein